MVRNLIFVAFQEEIGGIMWAYHSFTFSAKTRERHELHKIKSHSIGLSLTYSTTPIRCGFDEAS